jgi:hypothetical protein
MLTLQALRAIMTRKSTFLSLQSWLTIPFQTNSKDVFHHLVELVFELCAVLEAFDNATENESSIPSSEVRVPLALDCQALYARFETWFETLQSLFAGPLYNLTPFHPFAPGDESSSGPVFSSFLSFPDLATAQIVMNSWSSFLVLHTTAESSSRALTTTGAILGPESLDAVEGCTNIALLVAQSIPYRL